MNVTSSGGDGVLVTHNDANASSVTVNNSTIDTFAGHGIELAATGAGRRRSTSRPTPSAAPCGDSIHLNVDDAATTVYLTLTGNTATNGHGGSALALNTTGAGQDVTMLIEDNTFNNRAATGERWILKTAGRPC